MTKGTDTLLEDIRTFVKLDLLMETLFFVRYELRGGCWEETLDGVKVTNVADCAICETRTGAEEILDVPNIALKLLLRTEKNYRASNRVVDGICNAIIDDSYCRQCRETRWLL